ncbi:ZIP family metal transporter [Piscinibacter terrae]|uniref:Transporter n=1 Tax=Piscinibacter terrae TaxID=2496871 RepID=A0A3N7JS49_9BURK|nr:transporter [Albitalea terrae]RQP21845.1 transporter [Albitalea terrae]
MTNVLLFALIPAMSVVVGGIAAAFKTPSAAIRSGTQHIAAGVLFAALATELLPDVMHRRLPLVTAAGFALGVVAMLLLKALTRKLESGAQSNDPTIPLSMLLTMAIDIALDGLLIGIGFAGSSRQGVLLTIALTLEVLFLGVSAAAALTTVKAGRATIVGVTSGFAALLLIGAGAGSYFLADVSPVTLDVVMSFGVAALLYLVTEELLVEAHEVDETPVLTSMFFLGFLALMLIEMVI